MQEESYPRSCCTKMTKKETDNQDCYCSLPFYFWISFWLWHNRAEVSNLWCYCISMISSGDMRTWGAEISVRLHYELTEFKVKQYKQSVWWKHILAGMDRWDYRSQ